MKCAGPRIQTTEMVAIGAGPRTQTTEMVAMGAGPRTQTTEMVAMGAGPHTQTFEKVGGVGGSQPKNGFYAPRKKNSGTIIILPYNLSCEVSVVILADSLIPCTLIITVNLVVNAMCSQDCAK